MNFNFKKELLSFFVTFMTNLMAFEIGTVMAVYNGDFSTATFTSLWEAVLRTVVKTIFMYIILKTGMDNIDVKGFKKIDNFNKK